MANTILVAKNTFADGLIMDFAPDTTPNSSMSSALNATLLTMNGNELSLLNDMGNGRVETARLPDGYIPVGACEFGDIIYIVSYNPIINKSLIGCFPSPERNVSSEESGECNESISARDFQEIVGNQPTGELIASTKKCIIYNKPLNPGDKFIIYDKSGNLEQNANQLTDLNNTLFQYGKLPKFVKLHIVSIEDSGKLTYLDTTVKWYDKNQLPYYILSIKENNADLKYDIDSYRSLVSSAYSIFRSKVSGKLAILAELEKISGFSCTYNIYAGETDNADPNWKNKNYKVYYEFNWETEDNSVNPSYVVLTESNWQKPMTNPTMAQVSVKASDGTHTLSVGPIPAKYNQSNYWYAPFDLLQTPGSYNSWDNFTPFDLAVETTLESLKNADGQAPYKVTQALAEGNRFPDPGQYYVNLTNIQYTDNEYHYYTSKLNASLVDESTKVEIYPLSIEDDVVNNYFYLSIVKYFCDFNIPVSYVIPGTPKEIYNVDKTGLIYHYEVTPAMEYGLLREYSIEGYIDFSKINSGTISINKWKYYNTQNTSTLTLGLEAYPELNKGIKEIVLEFYDNQGFAAAYHIAGKKSYSGTFTEHIPLNGAADTYKLNDIDARGEKQQHKGIEISESDYTPEYGIMDGDKYYMNDCGTIYWGALYLVKIVVKYCNINALGDFEEDYSENAYADTTYYKWMWTNSMYNNEYYSAEDFDNLPFNLIVDTIPEFSKGNDYQHLSDLHYGKALEPGVNLQSTVQRVLGNINVKMTPSLLNNYNTFNLESKILTDGKFRLYDGKGYVQNFPESGLINVVNTKTAVDQSYYGDLQPKLSEKVVGDIYSSLLAPEIDNYGPVMQSIVGEGSGTDDLWVNTEPYKNNGTFTLLGTTNTYNGDIVEYIKYDGNIETLQGKSYKEYTFSDTASYNLNLIHFSKYVTEVYSSIKQVLALYPIVRTMDDLAKCGITLQNGHAYLTTLQALVIGRNDRSSGRVYFGTSFSDIYDDKFLWNSINAKPYCGILTTSNGVFTQFSGETSIEQDDIKRIGSFTDIVRVEDKDQFQISLDNLKNKFYFLVYRQPYADANHWTKLDGEEDVDDGMSYTFCGNNGTLQRLNDYVNAVGVKQSWFDEVEYPQAGTRHYNGQLFGSRYENTKAFGVGGYLYDSNSSDLGSRRSHNTLGMLCYNGDDRGNPHVLNTAMLLPTDEQMSVYQNPKVAIKGIDKEYEYYIGDGYTYYGFIYYQYADRLVFELIKITSEYKFNHFVTLIDSYKSSGFESWNQPWPGLTMSPGFGYHIYRIKNEDLDTLTPEITKINADSTTESTSDGSFYITLSSVEEGVKVVDKNMRNNDVTDVFILNGEVIKELGNTKIGTDYITTQVYVGDMIVSTLQSIYANTGTEPRNVPNITNVAYLDSNYSLYTKEVICQTILNIAGSNANEYLVLGNDLKYSEYLRLVLNNVENPDLDKVNRSNVDVILNDCIKTIPLQLKLNYINPPTQVMYDNVDTVIHSASGQDYPINYGVVTPDKLYEFDEGTLTLSILSNSHEIKYANGFTVEENSGLIIPTSYEFDSINTNDSNKYTFSEVNKYLYRMFTYDESGLVLKTNTRTEKGDRGAYSFTKYSQEGGGGKGPSAVKDYQKHEVFLPKFQLMA